MPGPLPMSDDYLGTITRLLGILKDGDENAKTKAVAKLWNVYIDRLCEVARMTLTSKAVRSSSEHSVIESVFDSLRRRANCGELTAVYREDGLWKCLLERLACKAAQRNATPSSAEKDQPESCEMPQLSRVEELVTKEPTALDINDILTAIDKIPSGTTKEVVLLHLSSLTDQEIAQKMGMSAWSVRRKIDLVRKLLEG